MASTLSQILQMKGQAPYQKPVTIMVVAAGEVKRYTNDKQEDRQSLTVGVADATVATKVTIYDPTKFQRFTPGSCVVMKNVIRKSDSLIVTAMSKVFPASPIKVDDVIKQQANNLINPPAAGFKTIEAALQTPARTRVSIAGKLVKDEAVQLRETKFGSNIPLKYINLKDRTSEIRISLWRELSNQQLSIGDYVQVTDLVINQYRGTVEMQSTNFTKCKVTEEPEEDVSYIVTSLIIEDREVTLLLDDTTDVTTDLDLVIAVLPDVQEGDLEAFVTENGPFKMDCRLKGTDIIAIESFVKQIDTTAINE